MIDGGGDAIGFGVKLGAAGFTILESRRTFVNGASLLVWARKDTRG